MQDVARATLVHELHGTCPAAPPEKLACGITVLLGARKQKAAVCCARPASNTHTHSGTYGN
eukprot:15473618-Alexandrium_andersonii.AAC.1